MAFDRKNFSTAGAQSRAGVVPQLFSYTSTDSLPTIKAAGYFPITSVDPNSNMLGVFKSNDWINLTYNTDGVTSFSIIFIANDGSNGSDITTFALEINAA